jgi:hypothetical protein
MKVVAVALVSLTVATSAAEPGRMIGYVERSTGLNQPGMESGRTELEIVDVNGDGFPDIVSIGDHGSPYVNSGQHGIMVWFGGPSGTWSLYQNGEFGYGGIAIGDVNGDGLMDAGYGMHHNYSGTDFGDQILEVALGDGTGRNWAPWDDGLATNGETWGMFGTDFADVDGDGDLDLGSISFGCCAGLHVYRNNGNGTWTQSWGFVGGNSDQDFVFGEINGDGCVDFAAAHGNGTVYLGDCSGNFSLADGNLPSGPWRRGIALGDVNDDGRADLSFITSSGVGVYSLVGPGQWQNLSGTLASIGAVRATQIADMNLDGHGDVVAIFLGRVEIYAGDGAGNWSLAAVVNTLPACGFSALRAGVDADHNGYPDFAFVAEENCSPWVGGINALHFFAESSIPAGPAVYIRYPRGGETLRAGAAGFIYWHGAVPSGQGNPSVSLSLSAWGPEGPFVPIATGVPNSGRYQWVVPCGLASSDRCYLRLALHTDPPVVAVGPRAFRIINPTPPAPGDLNCDGLVNAFDIDPFVLVLTDPQGYVETYPGCDLRSADVNGDGEVNAFDIDPFVDLLTG